MYQLFVNGVWTEALDLHRYDLINPATGRPVHSISAANARDARVAIGIAADKFESWRQTTPYERAAILKTAAGYLRENVSAMARDMVIESGKPLAEARGECAVAANLFEWYAEEAKRAYGKTIPTNRKDKRSSVIWQPMGVVGIITAWNFPAYNPARAWAAALGAGCTVVAKPAESTPLSAYHLVNALVFAGLPAGVLNLLTGDAAAIGETMLKDPRLKKISFTGSTRVGRILMDGASATHTRLSLELGGNAPVLIFDDVDVPALARATAIARFRNNGQVCIAPQRFYIQDKIFDRFAAEVTAHVAALRVGDGLDENVQLGPLITAAQLESVKRLLAEAVAQKASVAMAPLPEGLSGGYFHAPAVVTGIDQQSVLARNEIFGPVLPLFSFSDLADGVKKANDTEYGLAAYIFTNDLKTATLAAEQLQFGIIGVNEWAPHGTELPFGGWNASGQGHESGSEGLFEYMEKKLISIGGL